MKESPFREHVAVQALEAVPDYESWTGK